MTFLHPLEGFSKGRNERSGAEACRILPHKKPCNLFLHGKERRRKSSILRHSASRVSVKSRWQEKRAFRSAHTEYKFHFIYSHESVIHQETAGSRGHIFIPLFIYWRNKMQQWVWKDCLLSEKKSYLWFDLLFASPPLRFDGFCRNGC